MKYFRYTYFYSDPKDNNLLNKINLRITALNKQLNISSINYLYRQPCYIWYTSSINRLFLNSVSRNYLAFFYLLALKNWMHQHIDYLFNLEIFLFLDHSNVSLRLHGWKNYKLRMLLLIVCQNLTWTVVLQTSYFEQTEWSNLRNLMNI